MLITLFTDASFNLTLRRATWAAWFKHDGQTWRYSGPVRGHVAQSGDGELAAIANGLHLVIKVLAPTPGSKIIAQTDSQEALDAICSAKHPRPFAYSVVRHINNLHVTHKLLIEFRHVKGHQGHTTRRNAVNTWCDRMCKVEMGRLLAQAQAQAQAEPSAEPELEEAQLTLEI